MYPSSLQSTGFSYSFGLKRFPCSRSMDSARTLHQSRTTTSRGSSSGDIASSAASQSSGSYYQPVVLSQTRARYAQGSTDIRKLYVSHQPQLSEGGSSYYGVHSAQSASTVSAPPPASDLIYQDLLDDTGPGYAPRRQDQRLSSHYRPLQHREGHPQSQPTEHVPQSTRPRDLTMPRRTRSRNFRGSPSIVSPDWKSDTQTRVSKTLNQPVVEIPFMYSDPVEETGSVMTGMSQQELIRKKAREDKSSGKRRKYSSGKSKSKKNKERILNMPVVTGKAPKKKAHAWVSFILPVEA